MSGSLNKVILVGNLGRDPEIRATQTGGKVSNLSIATSERWKDRDGNRQEKTEWHRVVIFDQLADIAEKYLKKGSKVLIEGKLQTRKWQGNDGRDNYTTEIIVNGYGGQLTMLDGRGGDGMNPSDNQYDSNQSSYQQQNTQPRNPPQDFDDDIPF